MGAGVIGLSTALCITETCPSCSVTVLSDQFSPNTTSDVAAGILIPHTYPGLFQSGQHCPWHHIQLSCVQVCSSALRLRRKIALTCVPCLPQILDTHLCASLLCIIPLCTFGFVHMQTHRSTGRSSGSKRPSLIFLPSATQPRHQRLAFTWSLGKNSPRGSLWYICAVFWSRQTGFLCSISGVFPSRNSFYVCIPKKLHCSLLTYNVFLGKIQEQVCTENPLKSDQHQKSFNN